MHHGAVGHAGVGVELQHLGAAASVTQLGAAGLPGRPVTSHRVAVQHLDLFGGILCLFLLLMIMEDVCFSLLAATPPAPGGGDDDPVPQRVPVILMLKLQTVLQPRRQVVHHQGDLPSLVGGHGVVKPEIVLFIMDFIARTCKGLVR